MTVQELVDMLQGFDPNAEIRLAMQPAWPFEYTIGDVIEYQPDTDEPNPQAMLAQGATQEEIEDEMEAWTQRIEDTPAIVYLAEGRQLDYLSGEAAALLGWKLMEAG